MATSTVEMPPPAPPSKSALERVIGVFFSPGETFADIARAPGFVLPVVVVLVVSLAASVVVVNKMGIENIVRQQMMRNPRTAEMPKEQLEQAIERGAKFGAIFTYVQPVFVILVLLIVAGILFMMVNFVFGGTTTFKQMFAIVGHAWLPPALVLTILTI